MSATQHQPVNRDSQRQAALAQVQKSTGKSLSQLQHPVTRNVQHPASAQQLRQITQRNNYRGYDGIKPHAQQANNHALQERLQTERRAQSQHPQRYANALSGNESRSPSWQAQQQRGLQSRQRASLSDEQRASLRQQTSERHSEHREFRHR